MFLWQLLDIQPGVTALIGGGGKTTAMYRLASELSARGTVICTTTTHIFPPDHLPVLKDPTAEAVTAALAAHPCLCVGSPGVEGKLGPGSLPAASLAALADFVLVEADGSRGLPCKAHLPHEPVIPAGTGRTILLVGAGGFGQPISRAVHRPERFCELSGLTPADAVTPQALAGVIRAEALADRVLVNQVESAGALEAARTLAGLLPCPVAAGSLFKGEWICLS